MRRDAFANVGRFANLARVTDTLASARRDSGQPDPGVIVPSAPAPQWQRAGRSPDERRRLTLIVAVSVVLGAAVLGAIVTAGDSGGSEPTAVAAADSDTNTGDDTGTDATAGDPASAQGDAAADAPTDVAAAAELPDLEGQLGQNETEPTATIDDEAAERADGGCTIGAMSIRYGSSGAGVTCLQQALIDDGYLTGAASGTFDPTTAAAVEKFQEDEGLFVDGVVGRESAIALDIWPDEESLVVRTPAPPAGAMDSMGFRLSPVASTGADAPPLPDGSGTGRRVVYDRAGQRVWAVSGDGEIIRSWLVSGSTYMNEMPGTHQVYSRSDMSTAWNGKAWLPLMIRYQKTNIGHIGFHAIPLHVSDNSPYQTTDELGTRLSGGCQRQHNDDAAFLWAFADVGTTVVVT
jgi:peptidoglycan hydrolase-like protein with peptidoglycan-binding domain